MTESTYQNQQELDVFLNQIAPSLRFKVTKHIFSGAISKNPIFDQNKDLCKFLIRNMKLELMMPEDEIIRKGEDGDALYFIAKGDCSVFVTTQYNTEQFV